MDESRPLCQRALLLVMDETGTPHNQTLDRGPSLPSEPAHPERVSLNPAGVSGSQLAARGAEGKRREK